MPFPTIRSKALDLAQPRKDLDFVGEVDLVQRQRALGYLPW